MSKICIIGERDSVIGFMALGFSVHEANNADSARDTLKALASDPENAIIFIVENYAMALEDEIAKYKDMPMPAIIPIPGKNGSVGYGVANIKSVVERAVGTDILFKE